MRRSFLSCLLAMFVVVGPAAPAGSLEVDASVGVLRGAVGFWFTVSGVSVTVGAIVVEETPVSGVSVDTATLAIQPSAERESYFYAEVVRCSLLDGCTSDSAEGALEPGDFFLDPLTGDWTLDVTRECHVAARWTQTGEPYVEPFVSPNPESGRVEAAAVAAWQASSTGSICGISTGDSLEAFTGLFAYAGVRASP